VSTPLTWIKKAPGRWLLKAADGQIWAAVTPYGGARRGMYRATCLNAEACGYSRERYGSNWWTTGGSVAAAKGNIEAWLRRHSWDRFTIVGEAA
jgi:hypothetical protein